MNRVLLKASALILAGATALSLAACSSAQTAETGQAASAASASAAQEGASATPDASAAQDSEEADAVVGAYEAASSPVVSDELRDLFAQASGSAAADTYEPVADVASQVVAGTNHLVLCKVSGTSQDASPTYALVTLYEDLQGNGEITDVLPSDAEAGEEGLDGGWEEPDSPEMTDEAAEALEKAAGSEYEPIALVATQVVSGTNYCILCQDTDASPTADTACCLVYVYEDLDGNAQVTQVVNFGEA